MMGARAGFSVAPHVVTSRNLAGLFPFVDARGPDFGPVIGLDLLAGLFHYDPFALYHHGVISNPNVVVLGQIGRGKSALIKALIARSIRAGRAAFVVDPKGEYAPLAHALGGVTLSLRPGGAVTLNPLSEPGLGIAGRTRDLALLATMVESARGSALGPIERAAIEVANDQARRHVSHRILSHVVDALLEPDREAAASLKMTTTELAESGRPAGLELRRLINGDLAGMVDGETSATVNWQAPVIVLDCSALSGSGAMAIVTACVLSAFTHAVAGASVHRQRLVVVDEAWAVLRELSVARYLQQSWKLARSLGVANLLAAHRISDFDAVGSASSEQVALARGLLTDSETKILYAQPPDAAGHARALFNLTEPEAALLPSLGRGVALWKIGMRSHLVAHRLTSKEAGWCDTDEAMR